MSHKNLLLILGIALFSFAFLFSGMVAGQTKAPAVKKIDVNKATQDQLGKLPGLNATLAKNITEFREKSGPFKTPEDLLKVKGLTNEILNNLNPELEKGILYIAPEDPYSDEDEEEPSLKPSKC